MATFASPTARNLPPTNPGNKQRNVEILEVESEKRRCLGARRGR